MCTINKTAHVKVQTDRVTSFCNRWCLSFGYLPNDNTILTIVTLTIPSGWGSGGGSVGRAVASDFRGPPFESSHLQRFILNFYCQLY